MIFFYFFSSIFCEETVKYKFGQIKDERYLSGKEIKKLRKIYLKECPLFDSKYIKSIINSMGINFDQYTFDIVLFLSNNYLIDVNSRMWKQIHEGNSEIYNGIVMSPRNWIKNFFPDIVDNFEKLRKPYIDEFLSKFEKIQIDQKSYSTYKLFDGSLSYDEKVYILQRIGLLKTIMLITDRIRIGNYISVNQNDKVLFSFDKFLTKVKATIIELMWNDRKNNNIPFLENILEKLPKEIKDDSYRLNRKCRDNIHYGFL